MPATVRGAAFAVFATLIAVPAFADEPNPTGVWARDDGNAQVRIAPCGADLCATNVWIGDTSKGEEVGDKLIMTVKPVDGKTLDGKAFDPKRNMTYSLKIKVQQATLTTRGCVVGVLCKSVNWSRVGS